MSRIQHIPIAFMEKSGYNKQRREKEEIKKLKYILFSPIRRYVLQ